MSNKYSPLYSITFLQLKILPEDTCLPFHLKEGGFYAVAYISSSPLLVPIIRLWYSSISLCCATATLIYLHKLNLHCFWAYSSIKTLLDATLTLKLKLILESALNEIALKESEIKNVITVRSIWEYLVQTYNSTQDELRPKEVKWLDKDPTVG